jgi:hypothetical protein
MNERRATHTPPFCRPMSPRLVPALLLALVEIAQSKVDLSVSADGSYKVYHDGIVLPSAPDAYAVRYDNAVHTVKDGSLKMDAPPASSSGSDSMGDYTSYSLSFNQNKFAASFKLYPAIDAILFTQSFPQGLTGMAATTDGSPQNDLASGFPVFFGPINQLDTDYAFLTWPECMSTGHTGLFKGSEVESKSGLRDNTGTPLVLFASNGTAIMMSAVSNMMTAQVVLGGLVDTSLGAGFNAMLSEVPAGWTLETLLVGKSTINATVMAWGDLLLGRSGKKRTPPDADLTISTLGWWSDNGAYYYYNSEVGRTMQDTVVDALAYWADLSLPTRHVMYDSWWYWKECSPGEKNNTWLNCKGAVELWEPRDDVFPDTFDFKLPLPLVLHNRWFSGSNNTYITQLGFRDSFIVESNDFALPIRSDVFKYLMQKAKDWGMVTYEQ